MRSFVVVALTLQGLRKKPFEAGEIVKEDNLPIGQADELVSKGFLEEVVKPKEEENSEETKKPKK